MEFMLSSFCCVYLHDDLLFFHCINIIEPLRSEDNGSYICEVTITPEDDEFIVGASHDETRDVIVQSEYIECSLLTLCSKGYGS